MMAPFHRACPKCKGGCSLCGGSGSVLSTVADVWAREESRPTTKVLRDVIPDEAIPPAATRQEQFREALPAIVIMTLWFVFALCVAALKH